MRPLLALLAWMMTLTTSALIARAEPDAAPATLRSAAPADLRIGTAVSSRQLEDEAEAALIASQFNCLTAENEMKPERLQPRPGEFTFDAADRIVNFAREHDQTMIGHTLLWHQQSPRFLFEDEAGQPLSREAALANLEEHITAVVTHFEGRVHGWDVVNEAIADGGEYLRDTPARRAIGDDYIVHAFRFARAADPDVELYYNDYNIDRDYKRPKALRLLRELEAAGVRVDAVGIQGHWQLESPAMEEIRRGIGEFALAGYRVHLTELDVDVLPRRGSGADLDAGGAQAADPYVDGLPAEVQDRLATRYGELFGLTSEFPDTIQRITLWGTTDGRSWLNNFPVRGRTNHPLLFDRDGKPKPAHAAAVEAIRSAAAAQTQPSEE